MALTNDQITAQNFKDFYEQIRPYLNGQVPTFANQFSRSDLYSTDEKIIGQWIDGKPLYQKTIDFGALPNNTTKSVNHNVQNIDYVVNLFGAAYRPSDGVVNTLPYYNNNIYGAELVSNPTSIMVTTFADRSAFSESYVTIQYTKTTDTAIKVGTGTEYSTEEQIIGTWIDGKPLYQKTLSFTTASTVGANKYGDFYGCTIVNISGGVIDGFDCFIPVNWYYDANNYFSVFGNPSNTHEGITVKTIRQSECDRPARITVRYTKTTD